MADDAHPAWDVGKIVLLGESGVGKTNLLSRLSADEFSEEFVSTIGVEFLTTVLEVDGEKVKAQIWDTAGQERFRSILSAYYRRAKGAVLCYDVSRTESLDQVDYWRRELLAKNEENADLVLMLIGNKVDLLEEEQARIMRAKGLEYAQKHKMLFEETSAKTGSNVKAAFAKLLSRIYQQQKVGGCSPGEVPQPEPANTIDLQHDVQSTASNKKCC